MAGQHDGSTGWSQARTRRPQKYTDDHGRKWSASIELRSGDPTGVIQPNFRAPWYPDQSFLKQDVDDRSKLHIDYEGMLRSRLEAHEEYHRQAIEEATSRSWTISEKDGKPVYDQKLLQIIGPPPKAIEPVIAAMQGNSWILGFSDEVDERLVRFLPSRETRRQAQLANLPDFSDATRVRTYMVPEDEEAEFQRLLEEEQAAEAAKQVKGPRGRRPNVATSVGG